MNSNRQDEKISVQLLSEKQEKTMKTNDKNNQSLLLILTGKGFKYLMLTIFGFAIAVVVFYVCGVSSITKVLLSFDVFIYFLRVAVLLFCLLAITMIWESWS